MLGINSGAAAGVMKETPRLLTQQLLAPAIWMQPGPASSIKKGQYTSAHPDQ